MSTGERQWQCSLAGKVTVGLWCRTGHASRAVWYIHGLNGLRKGDEHFAYSILYAVRYTLSPVYTIQPVVKPVVKPVVQPV